MNAGRKTQLLLVALDFSATIVVFNVISRYRGVPINFVFFPLLAPTGLLILAIYLIDGYRKRTNMLSLDYTSLHVIAVVSAMLATLLLTFVFVPAGYELQSSRSVIAVGFLFLLPLTLGFRQMLYQQMSEQRGTLSLLFLGDRASQEDFKNECRKMEVTQPVVYSWIGPAGQNTAPDESVRPLDSTLKDIQDGTMPVEAIILRESSRELPQDLAQQLVQLYFSGVPTYTLELFNEVYWQKIPLYRLNSSWLFQEGFPIAREPVFERIKRTSDIAFAAIGLLFAVPFVLVAGALIWAEDRGPIFFLQSRIGKNQTPFRVVKLRTMKVSGEKGDPYTRAGDARITRIGRFLRASRLDEVPQLWNVLVGEMSLIGPRAEWDRLTAEYQRQIPCYNYRHLVRPGITGWAQVNFTYGTSLEDTLRKLEYDLYYIRHFSFILDASIFLKTIQVVIFGKGR